MSDVKKERPEAKQKSPSAPMLQTDDDQNV
jgi:hypothetical protein